MKAVDQKTFLSRSAKIEALVIFGLFGLVLAVSIAFEGFERLVEFSESHESWELDEILTVLMVMSVAFAVYSVRRLLELRREFRRRIAAENEANELAFHDPLTGLPNRRKAYQAIKAAIDNADTAPFAVAMIDFDRFKWINDIYGHVAGDEVLLTVAEKLCAHAHAHDFIARLGGDEFVVLIAGFESHDALLVRVEELLGALTEQIDLPSAGAKLALSARIGVTLVENAGIDIDRVITQADAAMYRAKASSSHSLCFFERGMDEAVAQRAQTERLLREAIEKDEIDPYFQPLVDLCTGELLGYEALARWPQPDGTVKNPEEFISIAEECGLIGELYFELLEKAAHEALSWEDHCILSVNISPLQFSDPWLVERTLQTVQRAGFPTRRLEVEITETALVAEMDTARAVIANFKNQGIQVSLDDFGTGYSSLRHLSELQFDKLKIDRSFIADIETNQDSQTIVRAVTSMAHHLGLKVIVEGIEDAASAKSVREYGCDVGQGFLYGKPLPAEGLGYDEEDQQPDVGAIA
ncbi:putative bifunctional diguanylate cyclase/phosphodiesterase [Alteriqipengyuania sp. 357]